ncbi:hypothetical protein [Kribbella solani]|uniref:Uncharacterized protein n=1 Tax=Kribbella solani TaxID=236067 RepID=A0A841DZV3_9ACTN|nr:hypothetical protein [Kribbella solani]MBB5983709.1 hypothetical protein [Kribbella solani]MDX3002972.1 hypothetical protein [Kribbella solani]
MKTSDIDAAIRALKPSTTGTEVGAAAWTQLSRDITMLSPEEEPRPTTASGWRGFQLAGSGKQRLALASAFSLLIAGVVAASVVTGPGQTQARALSFTREGDSVIVRVIDPDADPARYNAEFRAMGLPVTVTVIPLSPTAIAQFAGYSVPQNEAGKIRVLEPGEKCSGTLTAADPGCQSGLEIARNLKGATIVEFGRATKNGETYYHRPR